MSNTITAFFKGRVGVAEAVYQNDYGIVMNLDSIELPTHFDCYFSVTGEDEAIPGVGADNQIVIPNDCLSKSGTVTLHIPLHTGANDSEVEYIVYFKVIGRARPVDDGTPVQMTAIEQALALLQNPIGNIEQIVNEALAFTGDTFAEMQEQLDADQSAFETQITNLVTNVKANAVETLWSGSLQTKNQSVTLSKDIANFDFIDIYVSNDVETVYLRKPVSNTIRFEVQIQNMADDGAAQFMRWYETGLTISGTTATVTRSIGCLWDDFASAPVVSESSDGPTISRIDGIKIGSHESAELTDARVGADNVTYASAGEAVRNQFTNLKSDIDDINTGIGTLKEYVQPITNTTKKYINSSGVISDVSNAGYKVTQYIDVDGYEKVIFSASASASNYMCAFYDENQAFISGLHGTGTAVTNQTAPIPYNAKYVVLAGDGNGGTACTLAKWTYPFIKIIDDNFAEKWQTLTGTTSVAYIRSTGVITSTTGAYRVLEVSVSEGDSLKINAYAENYSYFFAFYDNNDDLISGYQNNSGTHGTLSDYEVVAPTGAVKIAIGGNTNVSPTPSGSKLLGAYPTGTLKWKDKKWVCFGDSLTAVNSRTDIHYFDYIAESTGITVVNKGVSGSGYRNDASVNGAFYQKVSECPTDADVVTIFGSFNDGLTDLGTASDTGTTTVGGCINTTIDNLYAVMPTVQLGIVSPTPWVGANPYNHSEANAYADLLEAICKRRSIPFLNLYYESNLRPWDATFRSLAYTKDDGNGVHPDETGHKIISSRFEGFLDTLLNG